MLSMIDGLKQKSGSTSYIEMIINLTEIYMMQYVLSLIHDYLLLKLHVDDLKEHSL